MQRFPVDVAVEFRGVTDESEYVDRESGETKQRTRIAKFERAVGEADVETITVPVTQFDHCVPAFDWTTLKRGEDVVLRGEVVLASRGERYEDGRQRESYFSMRGGAVERVRELVGNGSGSHAAAEKAVAAGKA